MSIDTGRYQISKIISMATTQCYIKNQGILYQPNTRSEISGPTRTSLVEDPQDAGHANLAGLLKIQYPVPTQQLFAPWNISQTDNRILMHVRNSR
jgi:hypothetical protein